MKVYKFTSYIEKEYAILRPSSKQNIKEDLAEEKEEDKWEKLDKILEDI